MRIRLACRHGRRRKALGAHRQPGRLPGDDIITTAVPERADCCPATPQVRVTMLGGPRAELWLCSHHYQTSRMALRTARALAFDRAGRMLSTVGGIAERPRDQITAAAASPARPASTAP